MLQSGGVSFASRSCRKHFAEMFRKLSMPLILTHTQRIKTASMEGESMKGWTGSNSEQHVNSLLTKANLQKMVHFPRALEENGMRPITCPSELVMFSCHQTLAQSSEFRAGDTPVLCDDVNHEKSIHVKICVGQTLGLQVPTHFRMDALTSKRSFEAIRSLQGLPKMPFMIHPFWTIK